MAVPAIPQNLIVQQGNSQVFVSWDLVVGATSYSVQRSTDNVSFSVITSPVVTQYLDTTVTINTQYFYRVAATNSDGTSSYTQALPVIPTETGKMSLAQVRYLSQLKADMLNSTYVTTAEWNMYINQSYFELYDLLVTTYEDYYVGTPYTFQTDGSQMYDLPNSVYKVMGIDMSLDVTNDAWVTLKKFNFISRNRYIFPNLTSTPLGVFNLRYRLVGNQLMLIPTPSGGQTIRVWFVPRMTQLLQDTSVLDGISGWTEYVICDAAIKALQKEESDTSVVMAQKQMLLKRIEETATNRDIGEPDTISNTRQFGERWGGGGDWGPNGDAPGGGY